VEALELCSEAEIAAGAHEARAQARAPGGSGTFAKNGSGSGHGKQSNYRFTVTQRLAGAVQLLMFFATIGFAYTRRRTVNGDVFSWWRQVPEFIFRNPVQSVIPMWPEGKEALQDGYFGRRVDTYHDRWYLWFTSLLPLHLATLACLFVLRRSKWVQSRFSQNTVTLGVSCGHIVLVHGVGCLFSFGAMMATLGVCKATLPLAVGRPRLYKLVIWTLGIFMLVMCDYVDANPGVLDGAISGLPTWTYSGVRGQDAGPRFGPFLAFRYLLLRLLSYSFDVGEKAHHQKGASRATVRDMVDVKRYFLYVTYAPLYLHGPLVQYSSFSEQWSRSDTADGPLREKLGKKNRDLPAVLPPVRSMRSAVQEMAAVLGLVALVSVLLHTIYMPTVIFYNLRAGDLMTQTVEPVDHFSFAQVFLFFIFLQSHTIFGLSRACAQMDGLSVGHDTPVSHFRSSTSLSHHWNWFHTTWRDFFMKYIYFPLGGGYLGLLAVVVFSVLMHGYSFTWVVWGFLNYTILLFEQGLRKRFHWYRQPNFVVRALNQAFVIEMQMFLFPAFVNSPTVGTLEDPRVSKANWGAHKSLLKWNFAFAVLNNLRLGPANQMDELPGFW